MGSSSTRNRSGPNTASDCWRTSYAWRALWPRRRGTSLVSCSVPVLGVIPARLDSSRLPRKPLLPLAGEPLILWVVRRVAAASLCDRLVVATDAREIAAVVEQAGYEAVLTSREHRSGTERVAEVITHKAFEDFNLILNVQGDEPLVALAALRGAVGRVQGGDPIGTAAGRLEPALAADPNRVKVVVDARSRAVYFSRAPIPFDRDGRGDVVYRQHVGVYATRARHWSGGCSCLRCRRSARSGWS